MNGKIKFRIKMLLDVFMTVILMFLMSYMIAGPEIHEWLGCAMFVLFMVHHLLNVQWHKSLLKGRYTVSRILNLVIDVLILAGMLTSMITGIMLSRYVFAALDISTGISMARKLHMLAAYWNLVLIAVHLGLHWNMMLGAMSKAADKNFNKDTSARKIIAWVIRGVALLIAVSGGYWFVQENISGYLLGKVAFAFFDFKVSAWEYVLRYITIMECITLIVYYVRKACMGLGKRKTARKKQENSKKRK